MATYLVGFIDYTNPRDGDRECFASRVNVPPDRRLFDLLTGGCVTATIGGASDADRRGLPNFRPRGLPAVVSNDVEDAWSADRYHTPSHASVWELEALWARWRALTGRPHLELEAVVEAMRALRDQSPTFVFWFD